MEKRILYQTDEGGIAIIIPSPEALEIHGIMAIALKDVPNGKPFKIVDVEEIPTDRTFRNAWEIDVSELTDGFGTDITF